MSTCELRLEFKIRCFAVLNINSQSRIEYGTRQRSDLQYKFCRTEQKSVNNKGIKQYHILSSHLKNVQFFRRKIKLFILQQTFRSV